ncbi:MAG: DUF599 family protein [Pseudomonadales bacterium]|nr:DUF599 family protein [Pseudomonadales bacterium]
MLPEGLIVYLQTNAANLLALAWFVLCFRGYLRYTAARNLNTPSLAYAMHLFRKQWIRKSLGRENRIADTNIVASLERAVSFFASTSLLILAGLITMLGSTEQVVTILGDIPFASEHTRGEWEMKVLLLICLFVYAFFKYTWSLRQFSLVSVMIGGAPEVSEMPSEEETERHVTAISNMASKASGNFNNGLRTYYFSMAVLGWFINAWVFMALTLLVIGVLYRREYHSDTLGILLDDLPEP